MSVKGLRCTGCGAEYKQDEQLVTCSKCGMMLDTDYDYDEIRGKVDRSSFKRGAPLWQYRELLPALKECIVSLGEGGTPLERAGSYADLLGIEKLFLKLDYLNPTGSFKDRGTTVSVSKLREFKIAAAMDDSSGNAGSSLAAYCAKAGIQCTLYVPANAPAEKVIQAEIYGATIARVEGSRCAVAQAANEAWKSRGIYYASHNLSPFFLEGMKTFAFEVAVDFDWRVPDHIVFPVGGGALLRGAWKGFRELLMLGWINRMPRLHCIQSESCMPIVEAFRKGNKVVEAAVETDTIAGGIRIAAPARGAQVLQSLRDTDGRAVAVNDESILRHQLLLARREGIFVEPTSCAALAGLERLREDGEIGNDELVVIELTGFGLKDSRSAVMALASA